MSLSPARLPKTGLLRYVRSVAAKLTLFYQLSKEDLKFYKNPRIKLPLSPSQNQYIIVCFPCEIFSVHIKVLNLHPKQCPYRLLFENVAISAL